MQSLLIKLIVTPTLIAIASLLERRYGARVGGGIVALPLTSGPVAFFLLCDHCVDFARHAVVGILAGTASQIVFALAYRTCASRGRLFAFLSGLGAFAVSSLVLARLDCSVWPTFALVAAVLLMAILIIKLTPHPQGTGHENPKACPSRLDIPLRMIAATGVVLTIAVIAPIIGPHATGLLSPFPVYGAVISISEHHNYGPRAAASSLEGLIYGLGTPALFFLILAITLSHLGVLASIPATAAALSTHATLFKVIQMRSHSKLKTELQDSHTSMEDFAHARH